MGKIEKENIIMKTNKANIANNEPRFLLIFFFSAFVTIGFNKYATNAPAKKGINR